ncbi:hypothetical protein CFC21_077626 [Triticum aestivum]|uniref:Uncharacterized protein n=2 Tax=Triticum aestivum TaxID=4565 RepID=A0A3B6MQG5_WHEAT|nr:hypothetical protein CFC21_077626 [Triticum aestivum]
MSFSVTHRPRPTTRSNSSVALASTSGFFRSSERAHSTVTAELSVPPAMRSYSESLDALSVELDLETGIAGELQQHVHHVLDHEALPLVPTPLAVLVHDVLQEPVEHLAQLLHPLDVPLQVHPVEPRDGVADVEHAVEQEQLVDHPLELLRRRDHRPCLVPHLLLQVLLAHHHARDHVQAHRGQVVLEHHHAAGTGAAAVQVAEEGEHLLPADVLVRLEALGAEELGEAHLAGLAPVGAVGGPGDVAVVVGGVPAGGGLGAVGEHHVVGLEEELGHLHGGADNDGEGPELELHERAVLLGQRVDGAVRERADEVEVADDRPRLGARREVVLAAAAEDGLEEEHRGEHHAEEGR